MSGLVDPWQPHICECCLATTEGFYKDIAAEYFWMGQKEVYEDMLLNVLNITVDSGPKDHRICELCIQKLRNASNFKQQVLESQKTLLFKNVKAEQLSDRKPSSLEIKLQCSSCHDDVDVQADQVSVQRDTSLDIKLEDSPTCEDDNINDLSDALEDDDNSSSLNIGNEIVDSVNSAKIKRTNVKKKQSSAEDGSSHSGSAANTTPQGKKSTRSSLKKKERPLSKIKVKTKAVQFKEDLQDPDLASRVKESLMKDTTLKLVLNSNLTLFDWFKNKYRCFFCKEMFFDTTPLKEHATIHNHKEITEKLLRFNVKYFYRAEISGLKCSNCEKIFDALEALTKHLISTHSINIETEDSLLMPFRLNESVCLICKQEYNSFLLLDHHMSSHYNKYICDTCGKGFRQKGSLKSHKNTHLKRNFDCKICRTTFDSYYKKRKHDLVEHKVEYNNVCPHCPEKFKHYIARMWHLIRNHGYKKPEFTCLQCGKTYITNALLRSHTRKVHIQERNYECNLCSNKYMRKCELTDHMKSHIQARDFVCSYCGKGFFRKRNLNEHLAIHVEEFRHVCPLCGKTFAQKYNMNMHKKRCQDIKKK